jgi:hypothetical protein
MLLVTSQFVACVKESGMYRGSQNTAIVIISLLYIASFYGLISFTMGKGGLLEAFLSLIILFLLFICTLMTNFYFLGICFFVIGIVVFLVGKRKSSPINKEG